MADNLIDIKIKEDNTKETLELFNKRVEVALKAVGEIAIGYAKDQTPVDTGRLRNSITYATVNSQGGQNTSGGQAADSADYALHGKPKDKVCVIGTNVEYAPFQEEKHHYLRDAAGNHSPEYSSLIHDILDD